jgi:hypothetical protein
VCQIGAEGIVSDPAGSPYSGGPSRAKANYLTTLIISRSWLQVGASTVQAKLISQLRGASV